LVSGLALVYRWGARHRPVPGNAADALDAADGSGEENASGEASVTGVGGEFQT